MKHRITCPNCGSVLEVEIGERSKPRAKPRQSSTSVEEKIVNVVRRLSPKVGEGVSIGQVRNSVDASKTEFDAACIRMLKNRANAPLFFQRHDLPDTLSPQRKAECVYYNDAYYHEVGLM